jgi:hypothetical protein
MKKYFFVLLSFGFLMQQCTKDDTYLGDHTIAEGIITEEGTGKPVANVLMRLYKCTYQVLGSSSCDTFSSTRTDAKGFFSFDFKHEKDYQYEINALPDTEKYFVRDNGAPVEKGRYSNRINLKLTPYAWVKLKVKNVSPVNQFDTIRIFNTSAISRGEFYGTNVEFTDKYRVLSSNKEYLGWRVSKNGQVTLKEILLNCPPLDTVTYEINY